MKQAWTKGMLLAAALGGAALTIGVKAQDQTKIVFWNFLGGGDGARMKILVDGFNKSQSKYAVEGTTLEWGVPFYTKVRTSTQIGQGPDLITFHLSKMSGWAPAKLLRPISTAELSAAGLNKSDLSAPAIKAGSYKGALYGVPLDTHPLVMYYNKDLAGKAGLLDANGSIKSFKSLDEFTAAMKAIKDKTGAGGLSFETGAGSYSLWRLWVSMIAQQNGSIIKNNKLSYGEAGAKALQAMTDWAKDGLMAKNTDYPTSVANFVNGKAAFMFNGVWEVGTMVDTKAAGKLFDYGVDTLPNFFGKAANWGDSHAFSIPNNAGKTADANKVKGALEFVAYVQKNSAVWAKAGMIPAYLPTLNSAEYKALKPNADFSADAAKRVAYDPQGWYSGAAGPLEALSSQYFPAAVNGQVSVADALKEFDAKATELMASTPKP